MVVTGKLLTDASFFALVSLFEWSCVWGGFFCTVSGCMLVKSVLGCLIDRWVRAWTLVFQVQGSHPSQQRGQAPRTSYESHSKVKHSLELGKPLSRSAWAAALWCIALWLCPAGWQSPACGLLQDHCVARHADASIPYTSISRINVLFMLQQLILNTSA